MHNRTRSAAAYGWILLSIGACACAGTDTHGSDDSSLQSTAGHGAGNDAAGSQTAGSGAGAGQSHSAAGAAGASAGSAAGSGSGTAGVGEDPDGGGLPEPEPEPSTGPFPPVSDFEAPGPYASTTLTNVGPNNNYTVYLPTELAPHGAKNPIVGWMSGGSTTHTGYSLLPHLATHGFVVVCANVVPNIGQEVDLGKQIIAGIDWALAENERAGSELYGKLDTTQIASMGYSMGSLSSFTIASDPRLTTTVHISGGNMISERIANLRAPAAFICGTPGDSSCNLLSTDCDIAAANCDLDFDHASTPVFYANFTGGHLGILTAPLSDRITGMTTAWLRYQLMGDSTLAARFLGSTCDYCQDPAWKVQQKNL
jgi:hypothetical protein